MQRFFIMFSIIFLTTSFSHIVHAKEVGRSIVVLGEAWIMHGNNKNKLTPGHRLQQSDIIVTGERGRVRLLMADGSKVYISPKSRISLQRYAYSKKSKLLAGFDLFWGKVRFLVKKLATKNSRFKVHTTTAVLGVRGTEFEMSSPMPEGANSMAFDAQLSLSNMPKSSTTVSLSEGSVAVTSSNGSQQVLAPGEQLSVDAAGNMSSPSADTSSSEGAASGEATTAGNNTNSPASLINSAASTAASTAASAAASSAASSGVTQGSTLTTPYEYGTPLPVGNLESH